MSTAPRTHDRERTARDNKVDELLPVYSAHIANCLGRPLDHNNIDDLTILHTNAQRTIAGIKKVRSARGCTRGRENWTPQLKCCEDHDLLPEVWHDIADQANLSPRRHPSVTTIEALCARLARDLTRAKRRANDVPVETLFKWAAGAA